MMRFKNLLDLWARKRRFVWALILGGAAVGITVAMVSGFFESKTKNVSEQVTIKSELEGRTTSLPLVKEGTRVKDGALLNALDNSQLKDHMMDQQIKAQKAEAAYIWAQENLEVIKSKAQSEVEKAELAFQLARDELRQYRKGEFPKELKEAEARITLARETLRRAEERLKWSRVLFAENFLSQTELQADELAEKKARLELDLAVDRLNLLQKFTYPRRLAELQSEFKQSQMALERTRRKVAADILAVEADLKAKELEFQRESSKLEKIERHSKD